MQELKAKIFQIYKIIDHISDKVYIGSTELTLKERLRIHEKGFKQYQNGKFHYLTSFDILKNNDYEITSIEEITDEATVLKREQYYIHQHANAVNKNIPGRTKQEYYQDNKVKIRAYRNTKCKCDVCPGKFTKRNKTIHAKSNLHMNALLLLCQPC